MSLNRKKKKENEYIEGEIYIQGEYIDGEYVEYEVMYLDGEFVPFVYEEDYEDAYDEDVRNFPLEEDLSFENTEEKDEDLVFFTEEDILNAGNTSNLLGIRWALDLPEDEDSEASKEIISEKKENTPSETNAKERLSDEEMSPEETKDEEAADKEDSPEETKDEEKLPEEEEKTASEEKEEISSQEPASDTPSETNAKEGSSDEETSPEETKDEEKPSEKEEKTATEEKEETSSQEPASDTPSETNAEEGPSDEETSPEETKGEEAADKEDSPEETKDEEAADKEDSPEETKDEEKPKRVPMDPAKKKKIIKITGISVAALLILTYLAMALHYQKYLFPNTVINGISCNNILPEDAMAAILAADSQYTLQICGREGMTETISANDIGFGFAYDRTAEDIKQEQNGLLWLSAYFSPRTYQLEGTPYFDEMLLEAKLNEMDFLQESRMEEPKDAHIGEYDRDNGGFTVVPETKGTALDREKVYEIVKNALSRNQTRVDLDAEACYLEAAIKVDDPSLTQEATRLNSLTQAMITYQFGDEQEIVDGGVFVDWIDPVTKEVDEEKVTEYLTALSEKYNTYGINENFTTLHGYELNLPKGRFGWKIDIEAETQALIEDIQSGAEVTREPIFAVKGADWGENDIGTFYVEIDMTNQMVYLVDNGVVLIQTPCVTGNVASGNTTPPGIFGVTYRQTNATLRGATYTSFVHYWMPFNGNIGMHDATWRGRFGGEIYRTSGSHGCVNLPKAAAAKIYESIYQGCPVICYYLTEDYIVSAPETEKEIVLAEDAYVYGAPSPSPSASPSASPSPSAPPEDVPGIPQETPPTETASPSPDQPEVPAGTPTEGTETPGIPHETTPEEAAAQAAAQAAAEAAAQAAAEAAAQAAAEAAAQAAAEAAAQAAAQGQP